MGNDITSSDLAKLREKVEAATGRNKKLLEKMDKNDEMFKAVVRSMNDIRESVGLLPAWVV